MQTTSRPAQAEVQTTGRLGRWAALMVRRRRRVILVWVLLTAVGILLAGPIAGRLSSNETLAGQPSYTAAKAIERLYGTAANDSAIVAVASLPNGQRVDTPTGQAAAAAAFAPLEADHSLRVAAYPDVADRRLVSPDGRSALAVILPGDHSPATTRLLAAMRAHAPPGVTVTATDLTDLGDASPSGVGVLGEVVIGAVGALIVLALTFGSVLALMPLVLAIASILATFLALGVLTSVVDVDQLVEFLVSLIGLGIAIDYSLLVVTRWREERDRGLANDQAVVVAISSAGRAVILSGLTVALGLATLLALPLPFMRSLGFGGLLIPLVTVLAATTLLPAMLSAWGPRLDRYGWRRPRRPGRAWAAWTRAVIRHRLLAPGGAVLVLGVLIGAAAGLRVGEPTPTALARPGSASPGATGPGPTGPGQAEAGLTSLQRAGFPLGVLQPIEILVPDRADPAAAAKRFGETQGVYAVLSPSAPAWHRDGTTMIDVIVASPTSSHQAATTDAALRHEAARTSPASMVTGDGPAEADLVHAFYSRLPLIIGVVALVGLLALAIAFRSIALSIKALLLGAASVLAACGVVVIMWQNGHGSGALWSIPANGVVIDYVPLMLFAFLFGLTMDYEVFILARIKEAHDHGASTDEAIVWGMARTGRLVTSAALILGFAFIALSSAPQVSLKVFATGMAAGILLDATVVRAALLPALVSLLGERAWYAPRRIAQRERSTPAARRNVPVA